MSDTTVDPHRASNEDAERDRAHEHHECADGRRERPLFLHENWETKPIGKDTHRSPVDRYPTTYKWMLRWTQYADLLRTAAHTCLNEHRETAATELQLAKIGSTDRLIMRDLHNLDLDTPAAQRGRQLMNECVIPALLEAAEKFETEPNEIPKRAIFSWYYLVCHAQATWQHKLLKHLKVAPLSSKSINAVRWDHGLLEPKGFPAGAGSALETLTTILDGYFAPFKTEEALDEIDPIRSVLPSELEAGWLKRESELSEFRNDHLDDPSVVEGIGENGRLRITEQLLPPLLKQLGRRNTPLNIHVQGPTSSGKSFASRLVASAWVGRNRRVIMLLPIKALVSQALAEWKELLEGTGLDWKVVPGSRDYPQHDEELVRGDYDIAVLIPEKLNALMARGMRLDNIGVVIIDELQMISTEPTRGPALEMLVTKLRAEHPSIPVVALSALLDEPSSARVARWLEIDKASVAKATVRPVPLVKSVRDHTDEVTLGTDGITVTRRSLGAAGALAESVAAGSFKGDRARTLDLCLELLAAERKGEDGEPSPLYRGVLCFVPTRDLAEAYAKEAAKAMDRDPRFVNVPHADNPYLGRFGSHLDPELARRRWSELVRVPQGQLRRNIVLALRSGAGYHTARLEPSLREEIENAFREGLIRLLFATDTLMLGVNLPADAVVISSLFTPGDAGEMRVASRDTTAQKMGRAGRLGLSDQGLGVIVVPSPDTVTNNPTRTYVFDGGEQHELAHHVGSTKSTDSIAKRAQLALADREAVFAHYVKYVQEGIAVTSRVTIDWLSRLLLEHSRRMLPSATRSEIERHVTTLFEMSLKATEPGVVPIEASAVVDSLLADDLIASRGDGLQMTRLGRALGRTGLPFADAVQVRRIAEAMATGAGDLTLLHLAVKTEQVRTSSNWIALRSTLSVEEEREQFHGALTLAQHICGIDSKRDIPPALVDLASFLTDDVLGTGPAAAELKSLIDGDSVDPDHEQITALLRACVLLLWMRGCPFDDIRRAVEITVFSMSREGRKEKKNTPPLHSSDVRVLGENCSYVFDTAGDLVGVRPDNLDFRRFERMSEALSIGLPFELSLLARMNTRATHRERLVHLVGNVQSEAYESVLKLVKSYTRRPGVAVTTRSVEHEERLRGRSFEAVEYRDIYQNLKERREKATKYGETLHRNVSGKTIPGFSDSSYDDLLNQMVSGDSAMRANAVSNLFRYAGLNVTKQTDDFLSIATADRTVTFIVRVMSEHLTLPMARALAGDGGIVVACGGVDLEVMTAPLIYDKPQSVVVEPAVLVESVAEVISLMPKAESDEPDDIWLLGADEEGSEDPDDLFPDNLELPDALPPDPGRGFEQAGAAIARMLMAAPPLMTRSDMLRFVDGIRIENTFEPQEQS
ncbi:DEAD/DEAH box helicase [Rhodococcus pyridinivorans]|uniref:DEAD/DEAH box helicase n=1 Tax=Rhodococcus pyridinivorans TaxID=103816 RepID=UPI0036D06283